MLLNNRARIDLSRPAVADAGRVVLAALMVWLGALTVAVLPSHAADVKAMAHPAVAAEALDREFLRAAFTMRLRVWPNGQPIVLFVLDDDDPTHAAFCRDVLRTFPYVLTRTWERLAFTGTGVLPRRVKTLTEMRRRIDSTPGALGYQRTLKLTNDVQARAEDSP